MDKEKLIREIKELKKLKNAVILAHNYQTSDIFEVADFIGDSLYLAQQAVKAEQSTILVAGVKFMADTAKILNPQSNVLIPDPDAGCPLADSVTPEQLIEKKKQYPDHAYVCYVNTSAEVKAMCDYAVTSANAVQVVSKIPNENIVFLPDRNLGIYVQSKVTDKNIVIWDGCCPVHDRIDAEYLKALKDKNPGALIVAHPEARIDVLEMSDEIASTSGMEKFAAKSDKGSFIIATETGLTEKLRLDYPDKKFLIPSDDMVCTDMKKITLEKIRDSLRDNMHPVELDQDIIEKAVIPIKRMIELS